MRDANRRGLSLTNVTVQRGRRTVLEDISLSLAPGEILAIVGPNGAGKTSLLEAAIGAVPLARGELHVDGRQVQTLAERTRCFSYMAAEAEPALELRVEHCLRLAQNDPKWLALLQERLGLDRLRGARVGLLSRGERRRLLLFEALGSSKPFLLLDEPTGVFDPLQLLELIEVFRASAARGTSMLLTLHQMSDAEALATRILILSAGRAVALGTMAELRQLAGLDAEASLHAVFLELLQHGTAHAHT